MSLFQRAKALYDQLKFELEYRDVDEIRQVFHLFREIPPCPTEINHNSMDILKVRLGELTIVHNKDEEEFEIALMNFVSDKVEIRTSNIPNAGKGLFAKRHIEALESVCGYGGLLLSYSDSHYIIGDNDIFFDSEKIYKVNEPGRYANGALYYFEQHAEYVPKKGTMTLRATRNIEPGTEILIVYGHNFNLEEEKEEEIEYPNEVEEAYEMIHNNDSFFFEDRKNQGFGRLDPIIQFFEQNSELIDIRRVYMEIGRIMRVPRYLIGDGRKLKELVTKVTDFEFDENGYLRTKKSYKQNAKITVLGGQIIKNPPKEFNLKGFVKIPDTNCWIDIDNYFCVGECGRYITSAGLYNCCYMIQQKPGKTFPKIKIVASQDIKKGDVLTLSRSFAEVGTRFA